MISPLHLQIAVDISVFIVVVLLLRQMDKRIVKSRSPVDAALLDDFRKTMTASQELADRFVDALEANKRTLNDLCRRLEEKEKTLTRQMENAERLMSPVDLRKGQPETVSPEKRYGDIIEMMDQGLNREEISRRTGFTEGEITLVMELARSRTGRF